MNYVVLLQRTLCDSFVMHVMPSWRLYFGSLPPKIPPSYK
jgi:hypothetical protein